MNNEPKLRDQSDLPSPNPNGLVVVTGVKNDNVAVDDDQPFSIFSEFEKRLYAWSASLAAFSAPVSSTIYYPALNLLAEDLHTTPTKINLTITTFLVRPLTHQFEYQSNPPCRYFKVLRRRLSAVFPTSTVVGLHSWSASSFTLPPTRDSRCSTVLLPCLSFAASRVAAAAARLLSPME